MTEDKDRDAAIERIRATIVGTNSEMANITVADLRLMFDEFDRLVEREVDAYHSGIERDFLT